MKRLDVDHRLFKSLVTDRPFWWEAFRKDPNIYIDIRKDNKINVYYNGGAIIQELKHNGKSYTGKINYKYLLPAKSGDIKLKMSTSVFDIEKVSFGFLKMHDFEKALERIKVNISNHYPANSEYGIQARFILKTGNFLDSEFTFKNENYNHRIDLIWIDTTRRVILPVELKTMGDSRLYTDEITKQLETYARFSKEFKEEIEKYYQKMFIIKKNLGILPEGLDGIDSLAGYKLQEKPLLIFGDCEQSWIDTFSKKIDKKIEHTATGTYYFGKPFYSCDLISKSKSNRHIYT
jgi:hypothetical protein